jgi:TonB family protein
MISVALASSSAEIVRITLWHVLQETAEEGKLPDSVSPELATEGRESDDVETSFMRELMKRLLGQKPNEDAAWIEARKRDEPTQIASYNLRLIPLLTKRELEALSEQSSGDKKTLGRVLKRREGFPNFQSFVDSRPEVTRRTVFGYPKDFFKDVLAQSGCRLARGRIGGGQVMYGADGRPRVVNPHKLTAPADCDDAIETLLLSMLPPAEDLDGTVFQEILYVLLSPNALACEQSFTPAEDTRPKNLGSVSFPEKMEAPKKKRDLAPVYPESAKKERVEGIVILEAVITSKGCVRSLEVLKSVDPRLDVAAINAVSEWSYEPARRNGEPLDITMSVTVNFALH